MSGIRNPLKKKKTPKVMLATIATSAQRKPRTFQDRIGTGTETGNYQKAVAAVERLMELQLVTALPELIMMLTEHASGYYYHTRNHSKTHQSNFFELLRKDEAQPTGGFITPDPETPGRKIKLSAEEFTKLFPPTLQLQMARMLPIFEYIGSEKRGNRNTLFAKIAADNEVHSGVRALAKLVAIPNNYLLRFPELLLMAVEKIANAKMNTIELLAMSVILADRSILMEIMDAQKDAGGNDSPAKPWFSDNREYLGVSRVDIGMLAESYMDSIDNVGKCCYAETYGNGDGQMLKRLHHMKRGIAYEMRKHSWEYTESIPDDMDPDKYALMCLKMAGEANPRSYVRA